MANEQLRDRAEADQGDELRHVFESAGIGLAICDRDGALQRANRELVRLLGLAGADDEANDLDQGDGLLPPDAASEDAIRRLCRDPDNGPVEFNRGSANGEDLWLLASARRLEGDEQRVVLSFVDISSRKRAEMALVSKAEHLELAASLAGFGIYFADLKTGEVFWSPQFRRLMGLDSESGTVGIMEIPSFVHPDDRDAVARAMEASVDPAGDGEFLHEHRIVLDDGEIRWILMQGQTVFEENECGEMRAARCAGVAVDMTERHFFEEQLAEARIKADAANQAKSRFLANISHEIRTPLTAILGFADVLDTRLEDQASRACINTIRNNGQFLEDLLNDVIDIARVESGKLECRDEAFDLVQILAGVRSLMGVRASEKGLHLGFRLEGEIPRTIRSDGRLVRQVLTNLVSNAIKFTNHGKVEVLVRCLRDRNLMEIEVVDSGVGIALEEVNRLFEPFEQDTTSVRSVAGSGLGLSIARQFVEVLGGEISVESERGEGSVFRFTFSTGPLDDVAWHEDANRALMVASDTVEEQQRADLGGTVMVVDDHLEIRLLLEQFVVGAGADAVMVEDGAKAVEEWQRRQASGEPLDAVLMDLQMPVLDGYEASRQLRESGYEGAIVAISANVMSQDRQAAIAAGCNDFLPKPVNRNALLEKLSTWLEQRPEAAAEPHSLKIAMVDDSEAVCSALEILLEHRGHEVRSAISGQAGLALLDEFTPDVLLLDLGLKDMTGFDLLQKCLVREELSDCTFVCVSGRQKEDVAWESHGFHYYLEKPLDFKEFDGVLAEIQSSGS